MNRFAKAVAISTAADKLVKKTERDGKIVWYIMTKRGKVKEGNYFQLLEYVIRNNYV
jgi:hypothetical protein